MTSSSVLVLIPSRFQSTRFPGKPLAKIAGRSMIELVYTNAKESGFPVKVVTDHSKIEEEVLSFGGEVVRVDDDVHCGSDRIFLAYQRYFSSYSYKFIVNLQGDEPLLKGSDLKELINFHQRSSFDICTLIRPRHFEVDIENGPFYDPNVVKAIYNPINHQCLYFSRSPIPYFFAEDKQQGKQLEKNPKRCWYQHIGIYSYTTEALEKYIKSDYTQYQLTERLEQLRALEIGMRIGGKITTYDLIGVDTALDIKKVENILNPHNKEDGKRK